MRTIANISRILTGLLFVFSGFVKAVDPIGSMIKFTEYFEAFGLEFMKDGALGFGVLLCVAEMLIGLFLLYKIRFRFSAWLLVGFMAFFTILTFVLAVFNPVSDCGCFGDAIHLTNWGTFFKNLVLLFPTGFIFIYRNKFRVNKSPFFHNIVPVGLLAVCLFIPYYNYNHLPVFDFRPYHIGANIPQGMIVPENAEADIFETTFIYKKAGVEKEFTMENYPWEDTTWTFVDQKSVLVKKGYTPPIHDFILTDQYGIDVTTKILTSKVSTLLLFSENLSHTSVSSFEKAKNINDWARQNGFNMYVVTSSSTDIINKFSQYISYPFNFLTADQTMVKTVIRSNPGLVLINNGTIINKWHANDFPSVESLSPDPVSLSLKMITNARHWWMSVSLIFVIIVFAAFFSYSNFLSKKEDVD